VVLAALLGPAIEGGEARADGVPERASAPPRVETTGCPPSWERELRQAIAVEIGATSGDEDGGPTPGAPRAEASPSTLSFRCGGDRVFVAAGGPASGAHLDRTLSLDDLPSATAPRVVALAAVELLAALDPALRRQLRAQAAASAVRPRQPAPAAAEDRRLSLSASGVYRAFVAPAGLHAWGGALDGRRASAGGGWSLGFGLEVASGERSASLGQTSALLASARATAGARGRPGAGPLALSFEVGARGGVARLAGRSGDSDVLASTVVRPWAGPVAVVAAQLGVGWFCTELATEAGWAAVSATGLVNDGSALAASGPWIALSLGVGIRPR